VVGESSPSETARSAERIRASSVRVTQLGETSGYEREHGLTQLLLTLSARCSSRFALDLVLKEPVAVADGDQCLDQPAKRITRAAFLEPAGCDRVAGVVVGLCSDRRDEVGAGREVTVERCPCKPGCGCNLGHPGTPVVRERPRGGLEDSLEVSRRVGAQW
jgi:hypothetical protein